MGKITYPRKFTVVKNHKFTEIETDINKNSEYSDIEEVASWWYSQTSSIIEGLCLVYKVKKKSNSEYYYIAVKKTTSELKLEELNKNGKIILSSVRYKKQ